MTARFIDAAFSPRLSLLVVNLVPEKDCVAHGFPARDGGTAFRAYASDCLTWSDGGRDLYFFFVELTNDSNRQIRYTLQSFTAVDREGAVHKPVDVRGEAQHPSAFFAPSGTLKPDGSLAAYVAFDADPDYVPERLVYKDKVQRLVVLFRGKHKVYPRA